MSHEEPAWLRAVALPGAFVVGVMVTLQSKVNGTLAGRIGSGPRSGIAAAVVSFGSGLLVLTVLLALLPAWRRDLRRLREAVASGDLPRWQTFGGLAGAALVATQGLSVETIGVALFVVAVVAGQTSSALVVDHYGLGPAGRAAVTPGGSSAPAWRSWLSSSPGRTRSTAGCSSSCSRCCRCWPAAAGRCSRRSTRRSVA